MLFILAGSFQLHLLFPWPSFRAAPDTVWILCRPTVLHICVCAAVWHSYTLNLEQNTNNQKHFKIMTYIQDDIQAINIKSEMLSIHNLLVFTTALHVVHVQCTYLLLKWHIHMFMIHWIQMHFGKHFAVIVGPVEHPGTGGVIVLVHSKLPTRM